MQVSFDIKIVDNFDDIAVMARCYYPGEGNVIEIIKGLSKAQVKMALCHEIAHIIDWYMSNGQQSASEDERERIANAIGPSLEKIVDTNPPPPPPIRRIKEGSDKPER